MNKRAFIASLIALPAALKAVATVDPRRQFLKMYVMDYKRMLANAYQVRVINSTGGKAITYSTTPEEHEKAVKHALKEHRHTAWFVSTYARTFTIHTGAPLL